MLLLGCGRKLENKDEWCRINMTERLLSVYSLYIDCVLMIPLSIKLQQDCILITVSSPSVLNTLSL